MRNRQWPHIEARQQPILSRGTTEDGAAPLSQDRGDIYDSPPGTDDEYEQELENEDRQAAGQGLFSIVDQSGPMTRK